MKVLNLCTLTGFPSFFFKALEKKKELLLNNIYSEDVFEDQDILSLIKRITNFSQGYQIIGYHYTRADKRSILEKGLLSRNGQEIREEFLTRYGNLFTPSELKKIKNTWNGYFSQNMSNCRDNRLFFNFTTKALMDGGAKPLLTHFGGEQIYMPLQKESSIKDKICSLGKPLIIEAVLNSSDLELFEREDIAKIAISSYHRLIRPDTLQYDIEAFQRENVSPNKIKIMEITDILFEKMS